MANNDQLLELLHEINGKLDKQGVAIEGIEQELNQLRTALVRLEQGQSTHQTVLKALGEALHDLMDQVKAIRDKMATRQEVDMALEIAKSEIRADINLLHANVLKEVLNHRKRIENIEKIENIPNPDKH